jgi:uncharacterized protein YciI
MIVLTIETGEERMNTVMRVALIMGLASIAAGGVPAAPADTAPAPSGMTTVYLVLLKKGPAWTAERTPATQALQEAHLANIHKMWEAKRLVIAGPFGDDGDLRGLFLFQAGSLDEAKALAASDPAVQAGRLVPEIHPWWVEKGALPAAGSYCQATTP